MRLAQTGEINCHAQTYVLIRIVAATQLVIARKRDATQPVYSLQTNQFSMVACRNSLQLSLAIPPESRMT